MDNFGQQAVRLQKMSYIDKLNSIDRIPLAEYPTPLEYLPRLSAECSHPIYIKRDDGIGPALGGNKTRKLEYLMADARKKGHRKIVTFGGLQSNHTRLTAAVANRLGMEAHLFYFEKRPRELTGNLLINQLLGAKMHFIPLGGGGNGMTIEATIRLVRFISWLLVGRNYFIPVGGHNWLGCLGYVRAALEIDEQARELGIEDAHFVLAAGSGGTLAGLMAGLALSDSKLRLLGIDVGKLWKGFPASIASLATEICSHLDSPHPFAAEHVPLIESIYVGDRYGVPSADGLFAMQKLACLEGILLDPVYTAKAFAGMLGEIQKGRFGKNDPIIFLHTGGLPALFMSEA
ncbi:MAG: D-cysteine desulfhydrase family protein [Chloroflexota bacterium]